MSRHKKYYVRPDGLHETIRTIDGKRVAFRGKTDAEVDRKILEYSKKAEEKKQPFFKEVSEAWEDEHFPTLAYNTARNYKSQNKLVTEHFGDYRVGEITPADIQAYLNSHRTQARKTVTNRLLTLNLIFDYAVLKGYVQVNPCAAVHVPKGLAKKHRDAPTEAETKIIKQFGSDPDGLMPLLILCTGCRKGEAMALLDTDIDHVHKTISITKSIYFDHNRPKVKPPKSDAGNRVLPIPDFLLDLLPTTKKGVPIFPGHYTYMDAGQFERMWIRWQKKTGLNLTAHMCRHGYATILFEADIQAKDAQTYLGHAQLTTTMDIYTHIRSEHKKLVDKQVNNAINSI